MWPHQAQRVACRWSETACGFERSTWRSLFHRPGRPDTAVQAVEDRKHHKRNKQEQHRGFVRGGVVERLYAVVDVDGDRAGDAREIATDHEDDAEFAECVRKAEDQRGKNAGPGKRQDDASEGARAIRAEDSGGVEQAAIERFKGSDERLHGERKTIEHGGEHEPSEGKSERMAEERLPQFSKRSSRPHGYQRIETENGGRKHERKSDNGFDEEFPAPSAEGEAVSQRKREHLKKNGYSGGETQGEKQRFGVHCADSSERDTSGAE